MLHRLKDLFHVLFLILFGLVLRWLQLRQNKKSVHIF